jgi:Intracellular proteinase inhibitor
MLSTLTFTVNVHAADLLPLAPGNTWTYREAITGESFNIQVGTQAYLNKRLYYTLLGYVEDQLLVRVNEYGNIVFWDEETGQDTLLISFEPVPTAWWEAPRRGCEQQGNTPASRGFYDGPAGRWDVVEIGYRTFGCFDAGVESEQFAENIGMVRRIVTTVAGAKIFDLVHARIGTQVISAGSVGAFSVTAEPSRSPGFWLVTLRIDLPYGSIMNLSFPSSQEYDARLRDLDGRILWTWSSDMLFAQVQHQLRFRGRFTATIEVPQPPAVSEGHHRYTVEAWMTNMESDPRFAAFTTVETR